MAEYGYVVGWLKVREVGCGWDGKQLRVVGWESRWDGICRHTTDWQLMGCTNHSDGDGMVACDGNEIPRPIPSHPITIPFVMVIPSHRITTHSPEIFFEQCILQVILIGWFGHPAYCSCKYSETTVTKIVSDGSI